MTAVHRVGLIVPSSNTTMETELPELLRRQGDRRFTFHSARARMQQVTEEELRRMNAETERAAAELADARPDVVATACLVAIMAQGRGYHCTAEEAVASALRSAGADAPVVSSAGALLDALRHLGARRVAMVTPYMRPLTRLVAEYLEDADVEVQDALSLEVPDNRAVAALDPEALRGHWRRLNVDGCDALVISACVQMPSLPVIADVERESGLPTVSASTATAWSVLRALGVEPAIADAGRLLAGSGVASGRGAGS